MTVISDTQIVPRPPPSLPELRAADQGVGDALESVLSDNTRRVYQIQWKLFDEWCGDVDLRALPAEPLTVARYLAVRAGDGASIATLRWSPPPSPRSTSWPTMTLPARIVEYASP